MRGWTALVGGLVGAGLYLVYYLDRTRISGFRLPDAALHAGAGAITGAVIGLVAGRLVERLRGR